MNHFTAWFNKDISKAIGVTIDNTEIRISDTFNTFNNRIPYKYREPQNYLSALSYILTIKLALFDMYQIPQGKTLDEINEQALAFEEDATRTLYYNKSEYQLYELYNNNNINTLAELIESIIP